MQRIGPVWRRYVVQPGEVVVGNGEADEVLSTGAAPRPAPTPDFEQWVAAHGDALTRFAVLVVGDRAAADDAVQEALSRAYPRWDRIVRADDPGAYVRRMVVNAHVSWWRRVRRRESPVAEVRGDAASAGEEPSAPDLWQECLALPPRQRACVVLRFYEGLSHAEVAEVLGVSEVTARTQTHRALKALRAALTATDPEGDPDA